jgi:hypothetical protein
MTSQVGTPHVSKQAPHDVTLSQEMAIDAQIATLPQHLTPEGLLLYCSSRLDTLDNLIKKSFADQQTKNQGIRDASKLMEVLHGWQGHFGGDDIRNGADNQTAAQVQEYMSGCANSIEDVYANTKDAQVREQCAKFFKEMTGQDIRAFVTADGKKTPVTPDNIKEWADQIKPCDSTKWASLVEDVKNVQNDMTKSSELDMISLQSLVAQRQLAVQLTTQLMQAVNEGPKLAASNIGRQ